MDRAIAGIKVLDLGHYIAGPYCAKLLADYGAEVVKVERPTGDPARRIGPFPGDKPCSEASGLFCYLNNNKRGITLNLKLPSGQEIFKDLIKEVDVVVENFHPHVMPSLGLDFEKLHAINPGLIVTSISNFGLSGPYRDYEATDLTLQALGGWVQGRGDPDREPVRAAGGVGIASYIGGLFAATATMTAVLQKLRFGKGNHIDVSLMEAVSSMPTPAVPLKTFPGGAVPLKRSSFFPSAEQCKDGYIGINTLTGAHWRDMCLMMGQEEYAEDPNYINRRERTARRELVYQWMKPWLMDRTKNEIMEEGQAWRVPVAPVYAPDELLSSPQYDARGFFVEVEHPVLGTVMQPGAPFKMTETPWELRTPAPFLGQHNADVYGSLLGLTKRELVCLRQTNVI